MGELGCLDSHDTKVMEIFLHVTGVVEKSSYTLHPARLRFGTNKNGGFASDESPFQRVIFRFHLNLPGCNMSKQVWI